MTGPITTILKLLKLGGQSLPMQLPLIPLISLSKMKHYNDYKHNYMCPWIGDTSNSSLMYCSYRGSTELRQYPIERSQAHQKLKCELLGGCSDKVDSGQES